MKLEKPLVLLFAFLVLTFAVLRVIREQESEDRPKGNPPLLNATRTVAQQPVRNPVDRSLGSRRETRDQESVSARNAPDPVEDQIATESTKPSFQGFRGRLSEKTRELRVTIRSDGLPVENARVAAAPIGAWGPSKSLMGSLTREKGGFITQADGSIVAHSVVTLSALEDDLDDRYEIVAFHPDIGSGYRAITLDELKDPNLTLDLERHQAVSGRLVDRLGVAIEGARVELGVTWDSIGQACCEGLGTTTKSDGSFIINGIFMSNTPHSIYIRLAKDSLEQGGSRRARRSRTNSQPRAVRIRNSDYDAVREIWDLGVVQLNLDSHDAK